MDRLAQLKKWIAAIEPLHTDAMQAAQTHLDHLTKPPGSLGKLEQIGVQLAGIKGEVATELGKKAIVVMAADHGVCAEGVSAFPQEVTRQMVLNFLDGGAAVNVLARHAGAHVVCVDIGVIGKLAHPDLLSRKVREGTRNLLHEPAMTVEEVLAAILTGIEITASLHEDGYGLIGTGEMGIGNTTASAALLSVLAGIPLTEAVGVGTGIDTKQLAHKCKVIEQAIAKHKPDPANGLEVVAKLGGLEIAGLTGVIIGSAALRVPVVIDGFISSAAALAAAKIAPNCRHYMLPSHLSIETGHASMLTALGQAPILHMDMRLGEGTGAALVFPIIEASLKIMHEMATFESAGISKR